MKTASLHLYNQTSISDSWLKAAVAGSLWATVEIIAGSFLHNMKIPFSGTILAALGVWMMISYISVWKETGFVWKAGLICALMKSLSPSAVILGPMIGIFAEALIIWLFVRIAGRNLISCGIAGGLALTYTLIHKILSYYILYGRDIISIVKSVLHETLSAAGMKPVSLLNAGITVASVYFFTGSIIAILAWTGTRKAGFSHPPSSITFEQLPEQTNEQAARPLIFLPLNLSCIVAGMVLFSQNYDIAAGILLFLYLLFCWMFYRSSFRKLRKPGFWIQMFIITLTASLFLGSVQAGALFSNEGFIAGLQLNGRAIILIFGFSSLGCDLRHPKIQQLLSGKRGTQLRRASQLAFSALPSLIQQYGNRKKAFRLFRLSRTLFSYSDVLMNVFAEKNKTDGNMIFLTAEKNAGKTSFAEKLHQELQALNMRGTGFSAPAIRENGEKTGYRIRMLSNDEEHLLCSQDMISELSTGHYSFSPHVFEHVSGIIETELSQNFDYVMIDEAGHLEIAGKGWATLMKTSLRHDHIVHIWVVRDAFVNTLINNFNIAPHLIPVHSTDVKSLAGHIKALSENLKQSGNH